MLFGKSKGLVGLDIGSSAIKLVELKERKGGGFQLIKAGLAELSPEAIVDGAIMDSSLVVETINRINTEQKVKNQNFGTSLSGHSVIVKKISLPNMSEEELGESIQWEAEQYIPFDINDVNLDYVILGGGGGENMDVLLVAVKKDKINDYTSVISQAGKTAVLVDVDAFALQNAYEVNYDIDEGATTAIVNIGASVMNINILSRGTTIFWRDVSVGGNQYTDAIQRELNLSFEQAESLKKGEKVGDYSIQSIIPILNSVSEDVASEIKKTLDFFSATSGDEKVDQLVLAGGSAKVVNFDSVLKERFGLPVEIMNPFKLISYSESEFNPEWINDVAPAMSIAVGLAIRKIGE